MERGRADDGGDRQQPLSTDAGDDNILLVGRFFHKCDIRVS